MHPNFKTHHVAVQARFSANASASAAIEEQVQQCVAFVERSGGDPLRAAVFAGAGVAGRPGQRPGLGSLIAVGEGGSIKALGTPKLSRMTRYVAEASEICKRLDDASVTVPTLGNR